MSSTPSEWSAPDSGQPQPQPQWQPQAYQPPPPWVKPGVIPLRPLGVGEIIDGAIATIRAYPKLMLGGSAIVVAAGQLLIFLLMLPMLDRLNKVAVIDPSATRQQALDQALGAFWTSFGVTMLGLLVVVFAQMVLTGFLTVVVGKAVLGQPITIGEAWTEIRPRLLPLLAVSLLSFIALAIGTLLCVIPGIWLWALFSLVTPVVVLEKTRIRQAFARSRTLVNGVWWRTFGILLLAGLIAGIVSSIIQIPFTLLGTDFSGMMAGRRSATTAGSMLLTALGSTIAGTIVYPFSATVTVLIYLDRRIRREGLDIELARAAGVQPPPAP